MKKNSMNAALQCNIPNDNKEHKKLIGWIMNVLRMKDANALLE